MTKFRDPVRWAQIVVVLLIGLFGLSAVLGRDVLNPYWITLITTVLGITIATSKGGESDDDSDPAWLGWLNRRFRRPEKVAKPSDHEPPRHDRSDRHRRRVSRHALA